MLPEIVGDVTTSRTFITPDVFDIKYMMSDGKENEYINKISTCVLENMNVKYGGDRYQAFDPSMAEQESRWIESTSSTNRDDTSI